MMSPRAVLAATVLLAASTVMPGAAAHAAPAPREDRIDTKVLYATTDPDLAVGLRVAGCVEPMWSGHVLVSAEVLQPGETAEGNCAVIGLPDPSARTGAAPAEDQTYDPGRVEVGLAEAGDLIFLRLSTHASPDSRADRPECHAPGMDEPGALTVVAGPVDGVPCEGMNYMAVLGLNADMP